MMSWVQMVQSSSMIELSLDGRISVITFHSLEDRLTQQLFKEALTVEVPKGLPFIPDDLKPKMELVSRNPPCYKEELAINRSHSKQSFEWQKIQGKRKQWQKQEEQRATGYKLS